MISEDLIKDVCAKLYEKACKTVPKEVKDALEKAYKRETSELAKIQLEQMLKNIEAAEEDDNVICQDNGIPCFFITLGMKSGFQGDLVGAIKRGMKKLYVEEPHIMTYQVNPFTWKSGLSWEGMHTPFIHIEVEPDADYIKITAFPKGTGSSMWSKLKLFGPRKATLENIKKFVLECLLDAGPRACPPYIIGVGVGGTLDYVALLAKKATVRPINVRNPDPMISAMEKEILEAVNSTGIGVMGLGGDTTALAVNIEWASCHFYRTPLAFELNCWPGRRAEVKIFADGSVEYL